MTKTASRDLRNPILQIHHLSKSFGNHEVLRDIDFTVYKGDVISLIGSSGSGKSTLLKAMAGVVPIKEGKVLERPEDMRYLPQKPYLFHRRVLQNVMLSTKDKDRAREVLAQLEVLSLQEKSVSKLSGGEAQRVMLARTLVSRPTLALLDEPASAADVGGALIIERFLKSCAFEGTAVILTTHNPAAALRIADWAVMMWGGKIVEQNTPKLLLTRPKTQMTASYIESWRT